MAGALVVALACGGGLPNGVVARIGGADLSYADFERYVEASVEVEASRFGSVALSRLFERFVDDRLLLLHATDLGLVDAEASVSDAVAGLLEASPVEISDAEIKRYYRDYREEFARPPRVRLRQILVQDRESAEQALAELEAGREFGEVAARRSVAANGVRQGDLARDQLPEALAEIVFALGDGEWSEPLEAEYGYRIFEVERHLPAEVLPLTAATPAIQRRLLAERGEETIRVALEEARREYNPKVVTERLPFRYRGVYEEPPAPLRGATR